jgi:hypothetical protein
MNNQRNTIWNRRLPSLIGILFFGISLLTITWLTGNVVIFGSKAAAGATPKNVQISNISDTSFTISYVTDDSVIGSLSFGRNATLNKIALDERDQQTGSPAQHRIHYITVGALSPTTKYFFAIVSGGENFSNNSVPYEVVTAPTIKDKPTSQAPINGHIILSDGNIPSEGIVFVSTDTSQLTSTLLKTDGSYLLPLNTIRKKDLLSILPLSASIVLHINAIDATAQSTTSVLADQVNPIPPITLSKNYDFAVKSQSILPSSPPATSSAGAGFTVSQDTTIVTTPQILTPKKGQKLQDQQPMFTGKASPNISVVVKIQSQQEIITTVQTDANGNWQYRPGAPLDPGQHTITIKALDAQGIMRTITQSFTVYASGSQFTDPSVTPTPPLSRPPTAAPLPTPTPSQSQPSPSPTVSLSPSPTIDLSTLTPSSSVSTTPVPVISHPPIPKSGSSSFVIGFTAVLLVFILGGALFVMTLGGAAI